MGVIVASVESSLGAFLEVGKHDATTALVSVVAGLLLRLVTGGGASVLFGLAVKFWVEAAVMVSLETLFWSASGTTGAEGMTESIFCKLPNHLPVKPFLLQSWT